MKTYAPGLVTLAEKGVQNGITVTSINLDLTSRKQRQYRLLVKPNPFNARILFQPYLSFVSSAKKVAGISSLDDEAEVIGSFMDDFVVKVYLPQLEDKVSGIFQAAVTGEYSMMNEARRCSYRRKPRTLSSRIFTGTPGALIPLSRWVRSDSNSPSIR